MCILDYEVWPNEKYAASNEMLPSLLILSKYNWFSYSSYKIKLASPADMEVPQNTCILFPVGHEYISPIIGHFSKQMGDFSFLENDLQIFCQSLYK